MGSSWRRKSGAHRSRPASEAPPASPPARAAAPAGPASKPRALRSQRRADDLEPAREPSEGELADLVGAGSKGIPVGIALAIGRSECLGHHGQKLGERVADDLPRPVMPACRFTEEPHAVADVTGLVVVDLGVALDEARQELLPLEVARDEPKRGQAEGALEDQVVD